MTLTPTEREAVVRFVTVPEESALPLFMRRRLHREQEETVLALRGLLAGGMLAHCIMLRPSVDFGVPGCGRMKALAVPYTAADTPSARSEFAHPDKVRLRLTGVTAWACWALPTYSLTLLRPGRLALPHRTLWGR